ncbi:MAG: patatin-like phospholipase family protein [Usitatibacter sp.]
MAAALLAGCVSLQAAPEEVREPFYDPPTPLPGAGVALVLSGGSARGFAHAGVIKALEANGLRPDLVVGSSAGSLVGALYASGLTAAEVESALGRLDATVFADIAVPGLAFLPSPLGIVRSDGVHRFVDQEVRRHHMEDFPIRFAAVATDLQTGEPQIFNAGDVGRAVSASSAVPGIITPPRIRGRLYGDGQLSSPLPVSAARNLGARVVIAVDVIYPPEDAKLTGALRVVFQAFVISAYRLKQWEIAGADMAIVPDLGRTSGQWGFRDRERLIAAGEAATLKAMERLRPLFERRGDTK